ncbi:ABC transporter ATP-binding protein [Succinivibrio sp.]|uniref:ABC transporter ATP-binding protein n=1 Tax=Succinivibrio sp. TaxID=2053619 RepID=UPI0025CBC2BE|nr:sn-glycerol-3-phosphate ABC transporter ATP-binding protein UgpC [Succinivibrio sp.]MBQ9219572.1 sn-glycerol-3-phosphate ABC transporter ATP-binding protein UgpC [Succinivibrio sp.]
MASIELRNVTKAYGKVVTLKNINLRIEDGELAVFVGPSGCGKSTMLRMIAGLEEISDGELLIDNDVVNDVTPADRGVAMVFQSYALYPHMTVAENMSYSLKIHKVPKDVIQYEISKVAKALQIEHLLDRKPKQLSGGQRQRVAIGRAIVRKPKVFTFDEPLSNLDAELRVEMRLHIARMHHDMKTTMVYVTHDQVEAMTLADKIVVMNFGKVEQVGSPMDLYYNPCNKFVAGFIGSPKMNFIPTEITQVNQNSVCVKLDGNDVELPAITTNLKIGDKVTVGIRPEYITVGSLQKALEAYGGEPGFTMSFDSDVVERLGNNTYIYGTCCGQDNFKVILPGDVHTKPRQTTTVSALIKNVMLFDDNDERIYPNLEEKAKNS